MSWIKILSPYLGIAGFLLSVIVLFCFFFGNLHEKKKEEPQPLGMGMGMILLFAVIAMTGITIAAILLRSGSSPTTEDRLLDMQGITLTITGAAIALVSILTTLQNYDREKKSKQLETELKSKMEKTITEQNQMLEALQQEITERQKQADMEIHKQKEIIEHQEAENKRLNEELQKNIRVLFDCNMDDEIHRLIRIQKYEEAFEKEPQNANIGFVLIDTLAFKSSEKPNDKHVKDNNQIVSIADKLLENNNLDILERINLEIKKADACYENGKYYESAGNNEKAKEYIDTAQAIFEKLMNSSAVPKQVEGYIAGYLGLCWFWQFSASGKKDARMLDESIRYYRISLALIPNDPKRLNSLAVSMHNKARLIDGRKEKITALLQAKDEYAKTIAADPTRERPWFNLASVAADIIHTILGINPRDHLFPEIPTLSADEKNLISELYQEGKENLAKAMMINPGAINIYYIYADLVCCHALVTKDRNGMQDAGQHLEYAEMLDKNNKVVKQIRDLYDYTVQLLNESE